MNKINLPSVGVSGHFVLHLHDADTSGSVIPGTSRKVAEFDNLITDYGLDSMAGPGFLNFCQVGSGSQEPSYSDTALGSKIADSSQGSFAQGIQGDDYSSVVGTYTFGQGNASGNLSEIGISGASGGQLFSRALILDASGNPTTITVEDIAILTVTYEFRLYVSLADTTGTVDVGGVTRNTVSRISHMSGKAAHYLNAVSGIVEASDDTDCYVYTGALGGTNSGPAGQLSGSSANTVSNYVAGSHYVDCVHLFNIGSGNGSIAAFSQESRYNPHTIQVSFDPPIVKNDTQTLSFTTRLAWGRKS